MDALIVVDVQQDFCPGGALPVPDGDAVVGPVNSLLAEFDYVVATRDWHPADHSSFVAFGGPWPAHCVAGTPGAQLHPGIDALQIDVIFDKGRAADRDGYSGFEDTLLERALRDRGVDRVHIAGLALDYCVKATALDAARAGFSVIVHRDATRAVELQDGDGERAVAELQAAGVSVV